MRSQGVLLVAATLVLAAGLAIYAGRPGDVGSARWVVTTYFSDSAEPKVVEEPKSVFEVVGRRISTVSSEGRPVESIQWDLRLEVKPEVEAVAASTTLTLSDDQGIRIGFRSFSREVSGLEAVSFKLNAREILDAAPSKPYVYQAALTAVSQVTLRLKDGRIAVASFPAVRYPLTVDKTDVAEAVLYGSGDASGEASTVAVTSGSTATTTTATTDTVAETQVSAGSSLGSCVDCSYGYGVPVTQPDGSTRLQPVSGVGLTATVEIGGLAPSGGVDDAGLSASQLPPGTYYYDPCQENWAVFREGATPESYGYCPGGAVITVEPM